MSRRVLVLGATGTIGRATVRELVGRGDEVVCVVRSRARAEALANRGATTDAGPLEGAEIRVADLLDPATLGARAFHGPRIDAVISCLASRTGVAADAWAVDHQAHLNALAAGRAAGVAHMVLLSAICVQRPRLAFQHAKLAFERALAGSGLAWSIVRPTAYFKSLSGQVARVARGAPFMVFGDGCRTACKPIGDADLAAYLVDCLREPARRARVLPIGGPGDAITPRQQAALLAALLGRPVPLRRVPVALLDVAAGVLSVASRVAPGLSAKAELARIGRYYATESMLVLDPASGRYDAAATPSTGTQTLADHYARLLRGDDVAERGAHAVF